MLKIERNLYSLDWEGVCDSCHNVDDYGGAISGTQYSGSTREEVYELYLEHVGMDH